MSKIAIYAIIMCYSLSMAFSHESTAQRKYLSEINLELKYKGTNLLELLNEIERSSEFTFAYSKSELKRKKVNLTKPNWNMDDLLKEISVQAEISLRRINETITIRTVNQKENLPIVSEILNVQVDISGKVTDENGEPLPGATVVEKGTSNGTITDIDGTFKLNVSEGANLLISFVGFETVEVNVSGQTYFDIEMIADLASLDEVVVVGYGSVKKSDLTGSVAALKGNDLNKTPTSSVDQLLQGKIAGVQVITSSGEPGAGATIRIRGISSLNGSNSPLVVVDGFPFGDAGNLKQINPEDIESIEVLKDASAAAIYGSRGANGVILITTKKGKAGKGTVTFSTLNTLSTLPSELDVWRDPVDLAIIANEARVNAGQEPLYTGETYLGTYFPSVPELRGVDPNRPKWPHFTDWPSLVYRNPLSHSYTVTATGGNEKTTYSISGSYYKEEGLVINNNYDRYSARLNLNQNVLEKLKVGINTIITHTRRNGGGLSADRNPIFPVYDSTGNYFKEGPLDFGHPIAYANEVLNQNKSIDILGTAYANWEIADWLQFRTQISNKFGHAISDRYEPRDVTYTGFQFVGFGSIDNWSGNEVLNENYFTFDKQFGNIHNLTVMAGFSTQLSNSRGSRLEGHGFVNDNLLNENMNAAQEQITSNWLDKSVLSSWIGRASYSLLDRYLFTVTARADGSSKFGANNKWAFFPSAAVAWKLHEESFLSGISAITQVKLRGSYGLTGNQGIQPYQTLDRLGTGRYFTGGDFQIGFGPGVFDWDGYNKIWSGVPNESLKWETTTQTNVGLDLGLIRHMFTLSIDYYYKETSDLLRRASIPSSSGYDRIWVNDGTIKNQGIEIGSDVQIFSGNFQWNVGGNFTLNRNTVVDMGENDFVWNGEAIEMLRSPLNALIPGEPYNAFYGYVTDGIIQTEEEGLAAGLTGNLAQPGEIKYVDISGPDGEPDGIIDDNDRTVIGDPNPDFIYSFNTKLSYSGFDLSVQLYGVQGNDVFDFRKFSPSRQLQRWTPDNPTEEFPSVNSVRAYYGSDWFVTDGSFLRVQNLTFGYTFRDGLIPGVENLRIYLSGNNLFTFSKFHTGFDPEVQENGQHWGSYPRPRAYSLGVNVSF